MNLKTGPQLGDCFNWSMAPSQSELVVFARVSEPAVDLETTPPDGPWLEATAAAVPWSLGVDIAIWNAVGKTSSVKNNNNKSLSTVIPKVGVL